LQDVPLSGYRIEQGREPTVLHHLQLVRFSPLGHRHQDRILGPSRQEKEDEGLDGKRKEKKKKIRGREVPRFALGRFVAHRPSLFFYVLMPLMS
jgi:hypothetical protein